MAEDSARNSDRGTEGNASVSSREKITPLPKLQLSVLLYTQLAEPMTGMIILPFITQLVQETGITGGDVNKVGYYVGLIESLFFVTQSLMILQIGRLSDRIGRRPVLLMGLFGLGLSMALFGLSRTFWTIVASRALAGVLNGNAGVIKCAISEITDDTNLARGLSFMPVAWSVGCTLGPLIGGTFQHPYERFGGIFRSGFWKTNPYFLPCIISTVYSFSAFLVTYCLLKETAPSIIKDKPCVHAHATSHNVHINGEIPQEPINEHSPLLPNKGIGATLPLSALLTPRVRLVMLNYSLLSLVEVSFSVLRSIFMSLPISNGGLGMSPSLIGIILSCSGVLGGIISIFLFSPLNKRFGTRAVFASCQTLQLICLALFPVMNWLARLQGGLGVAVWTTLIVQLVLMSFTGMAFSSMFIFLTSAAPSRSALGATNGLAQTVTSLMRAIGPACATSLFSFSMERHLLGGSFVYLVCCMVSGASIIASSFLPRKVWRRED